MKKIIKLISSLVLSTLIIMLITSCGKHKNVDYVNLSNNALAQSNTENAYIEDCPNDFEFIIKCDVITVDNMYDHVIVLDCYNQMRVLGLRKCKYGYIVASKEEYIPGEVYTIIVANDTTVLGYINDEEVIVNDGYGYSSKEICFGIKKEETNIVEYNYSNIKVLKESDITLFEDDYIVSLSGLYYAGDVVAITGDDKKIGNESIFIKVQSVINSNGSYKIYYESPQLEEIYSKLDIYQNFEFDYSQIDLDAVDKELVVENIKNSETYERFLCAASVVNSNLSTSSISDDIKIEFKLSKSNNGVSAVIKLSYSYKGFTIQLIFEPTLKIDIKASAKLDLKFLIWESSLNMDFSVTTNLEMPITLKLMYDYKMSDQLKNDIISALSSNESKDNTVNDILNAAKDNSVKNNEIEIDIFESPQYQIPYTPLGISLDVDFVIDLQIHAELSATVTYKNKTTIGVKTTSSGLQKYSSEEKQFVFNSVIIEGKIEARAGIRFSGKLGILGLSKYVNISLSFDVGAYITITGKIVFESRDGTISGFELNEAIYCIESGIYLKLSIGFKLFTLSKRITLAEAKLPFMHIGNELRETLLLGDQNLELKTKLNGVNAIILKLNLRVKTVNLLTEEITYPIPELEDLSFEFDNGENISYSNGFFRINLDVDSFEDDVIIKYKNDDDLSIRVHIAYLNVAALDGMYQDEYNAVYELDMNTHTYKLVSVPTNVESYTVLEKISNCDVVGIDDCAFYNCKKLKEVLIPSTVKTIGDQAFYNCESLVSIDLSNVESIGESVFRKCKSLESVKLSNNIKTISEYMFYGCENLKTISMNGVSEFGAYAFYDCDSLISIKLYNDAILNGSSFANCDNLICFDTNGYEIVLNDSPFFNCNSSLCIAVNVAYLDYYKDKFSSYSRYFVDGTLVFDEYILEATEEGYRIKTYIGNEENVIIPSSIGGYTITEIGSKAFNKNVKTITLPSTIETISSKAFYNCENLVLVTILNTEEVVFVGSAAFWGTNSKLEICVPFNMYTLYKENANWTIYYNQIIFKN